MFRKVNRRCATYCQPPPLSTSREIKRREKLNAQKSKSRKIECGKENRNAGKKEKFQGNCRNPRHEISIGYALIAEALEGLPVKGSILVL
jgi:hypothetical protein